MNTDINLFISHNEAGRLKLEVTDFINGKDIVDIALSLGEHNADLYTIDSGITYYDFNTLKFLIQFGLNNIEQKYYHIEGTVSLDMKIIGISFVAEKIVLDAKICLDENNQIIAKISLIDIPRKKVAGYATYADKYSCNTDSSYSQNNVGTADCDIYIKDGNVYIERTNNIEFTKGFLINVKKINELCTRQVITDVNTFTANMGDYFMETILDFSDDIKKLIADNSSGSSDVSEMSFESLLTKYLCEDTASGDKLWTLGVNINALLGGKTFGNTTLVLGSSGDHLSTIKVDTSIVSIIYLGVEASLTDYGVALSSEEETAILNKISSFQPLAYTFNEALGETSSHARA